MTTKYWLRAVYIVETLRWPKASYRVRVDPWSGDAEARRAVAVDRYRQLLALVLLVAIRVADAREPAHALEQALRPGIQIGECIGAKRVLVLRIAAAPAHANVLHRL